MKNMTFFKIVILLLLFGGYTPNNKASVVEKKQRLVLGILEVANPQRESNVPRRYALS